MKWEISQSQGGMRILIKVRVWLLYTFEWNVNREQGNTGKLLGNNHRNNFLELVISFSGKGSLQIQRNLKSYTGREAYS